MWEILVDRGISSGLMTVWKAIVEPVSTTQFATGKCCRDSDGSRNGGDSCSFIASYP